MPGGGQARGPAPTPAPAPTLVEYLLERLYVISGYLAAGFMVLLAICIMTSIGSAWAGVYVPGITAYAGYCMAASSFLALAYTFRDEGHIRVGIVLSRLHGRSRKLLELWCLAVASVLTAYLAFYSIKMTWVSYRFEEKSEGADATLLWIPQSGMAIGATILAIAVAHTLVRTAATPSSDPLFEKKIVDVPE